MLIQMKKHALLILLAAMCSTGAFCQKDVEAELVKKANAHFEAAQYLKAYPLFSQLVSLHPQDPTYNYKFGTCAIYGQADKSQAIKHLSIATRKEVNEPMAWYYLGKAYHLNYQFREAGDAYRRFEQMAGAKEAAKTDVARNMEMCRYGSGLLTNMKDVVVMSKTESDRANFFRYMNLDDVGGKIIAIPPALRTKLDEKSPDPGVLHTPGNSTIVYFSSYGKDGTTGKDIYTAQVLPDGTFSEPQKVLGDVNTTYDEDFCFMHSDGKTLYFSSRGHNSMGGYDIFKSELNKNTGIFGPAVNLDFAINTPDDDIFFIADSLNKRAWFASARTSDQEHLNVYNVMVEGIPTQVTYLKGVFASEINPDQKHARIQVKESGTLRTVYDAVTGKNDGQYVLYVPRAGEYRFLVTTENSPVVHEGIVNIPATEFPVAFSQELKLVRENGTEKLLIINHFDQPLSDDLASLAAEMLRKKAGLEVNASPEVIEMLETSAKDEMLVENSMDKVHLTAGFSDGKKAEDVLADINTDIAGTRKFLETAGLKANAAYAYAAQQQQVAEQKLREAEALRASANTYSATESDIAKLRKSMTLMYEAEASRAEALNAMAAAQTTLDHAAEKKAELSSLEANAGQLSTALKTGDFSQALAALKTEKQRQVELRAGEKTPATALYAAASARETDAKNALLRIDELRNNEAELLTKLRISEQEMAAAKKPKDKAAAEMNFANAKSALDMKRREITQQTMAADKIGEEAAGLLGQAKLYEKLHADPSHLGMASATAPLNDIEKNNLRMKLGDMTGRIEALEIHDPQMLVLLGEPTEAEFEPSMALAAEQPAAPTPVTARNSRITPESTPAEKRMINWQTLQETDASIASMELRKSALTENEKKELEDLKALQVSLTAELATDAGPPASQEEIRLLCNEVTPGYDGRKQEIINANTGPMEMARREVMLNKETLTALKSARKANAEAAASTNEPAALAAFAANHEKLDAAIEVLEKQSTGLAPYRTAYDIGNREIIENDKPATDKLRAQVTLSEAYLATLVEVQKEMQQEIGTRADASRQTELRNALSTVMNEQDAVSVKLNNYRADLDLTAATSEAPADRTAVVMNAPDSVFMESESPKTPISEEEIDSWLSEQESEAKSVDPANEEDDDGKIIMELFKPVKEEESIIAYETGALDEIISEHEMDSLKVNNRDRIAQIQDEIFLIEAEMENASSMGKQRKLDRDAEKLYFKKSILEIGNAEAIGKMTHAEFDQTKSAVDKIRKEKSALIDSRVVIRDEIRSLYNKAKDEMEDASILRKKAGPIVDDIEKNDYYRKAFAKEMYAIRMLQKIEEINGSLDMLLKYNDQELTALRYGKPLPSKPGETLAEQSKSSVVLPDAQGTTKSTSTAPKTAPAGETAAGAKGNAATGSTSGQTSGAGNTAAPAADSARNNAGIAENRNADAGRGSGSASPAATGAAPSSGSASGNAAAASRGSAGAYAAGDASSMFFMAPSVLEKDLFMFTDKSPYSASAPIPVDAAMPAGIYYKVQVGAFRNNIPQNLFDEFAPVAGESLSNGITRYTAGYFINYGNASKAKAEIRTLGYNDAFIVAYRDGKRIPLYDAMGKTEGDNFMDLIEAEYVHGDSAPKKPEVEAAPLNTSYYNYKKFPNAARVNLVEDIKGLFYTVQVGVYSQPVPASAMFNISPLNSEFNDRQQLRYSSGIYMNVEDALGKRIAARQMGIKDAFVTAYYNGRRISLTEADKLLTELGPSILATE